MNLNTLSDFKLEQSREIETVDEQADSAADGSLQADLVLPDGVDVDLVLLEADVLVERLRHLLHRIRHHQGANSVAGR
ncbi:hypothetical protein Q3G72_019439 [Acer saccharum]|nr:hypothetical protein Q3G72_019439 [Acer saccharum]